MKQSGKRIRKTRLFVAQTDTRGKVKLEYKSTSTPDLAVLRAATSALVHRNADEDDPEQQIVQENDDETCAFLSAPYTSPDGSSPPVVRMHAVAAEFMGYKYGIPITGVNGLQFSPYSHHTHRKNTLSKLETATSKFQFNIYDGGVVEWVKMKGKEVVAVVLILIWVDDWVYTGVKWAVRECRALLKSSFKFQGMQPIEGPDKRQIEFLKIRIMHCVSENWVIWDQSSYAGEVGKGFAGGAPPVYAPLEWVITDQDDQDDKKREKTGTAEEAAMRTTMLQFAGKAQQLRLSRPDVKYACSVLSSHASRPSIEALNALGKVARYLKVPKVLKFSTSSDSPHRPKDLTIAVECDADFSGRKYARSGYNVFVGSNPVEWGSETQTIRTTNPHESEMVAGCDGLKSAQGVQNVLGSLSFFQLYSPKVIDEAIQVLQDSGSNVKLNNGEGVSKRSRSMEARYLFVKGAVISGSAESTHIPRKYNTADIHTHPLHRSRFKVLCELLNVVELDNSHKLEC